MVCQAASQTRFRALKHETGIAGQATIIVRVIACFQPLQNCQAEYFRQLLKPVT
nr:transcription factor BHLH021 [Ipomoea trifida]